MFVRWIVQKAITQYESLPNDITLQETWYMQQLRLLNMSLTKTSCEIEPLH